MCSYNENKQVAREMSEDKARSGGDLGWIVRGKMVYVAWLCVCTSLINSRKEFEDIAFSLPIGGISRPFKTCHGWHLAKCEGVK